MAVEYRSGEQRFAAIAGETGAVWLDSGDGSHARGRYDIIACHPQRSARTELNSAPATSAGNDQICTDPFQLMQEWHRPARRTDPPLPFTGGLVGFLGYDLNQTLEHLSPPRPPANQFPVAWLAYYPWALVQDLQKRSAWLVADSPTALQEAREQLARMDRGPAPSADFQLLAPWQHSMSHADYQERVRTIKDYILAGDCYQVNLARHFMAPYTGDSWHAYRLLRKHLPAPFSAFINTGSGTLLSLSPERFLQIEQGKIGTSPIKGTRPRNPDPTTDRALAAALLASPKDRAENLMIVDLLRNDLGKSCRPGSITVDTLFALETHPNVHHLVSTISGTLRKDITPLDALKNAFPGGSITGAPKIRAMNIIRQLEPVARSAYCGSVFYYSNHGRLDSSITIRSLFADPAYLHCWGGGGIVADSDPAEELAETQAKIDILLTTLGDMTPRDD